MRSYENLSDHDFEFLIAELLGAALERRFELFARGADRGVDLRSARRPRPDEILYTIVQCKHMRQSSFSQLETAAKKEKTKLDKIGISVERYLFVTSQKLTQDRKKKLLTALTPWLKTEEEIIGAEDLEVLLDQHPHIERAHVKLYLQGFGQLSGVIHSAIWTRSRILQSDISRSLPLYVETGAFGKARETLLEKRTLIIAGPPGIGKTTLARMLLADAVRNGYEPVEVSRDVEEAFKVLETYRKQVFYYDDFLGDTFLEDRLAKNEDRRLTSFIAECSRSERTLFLLTTRSHILNQATRVYEEFKRAGLHYHSYLLHLGRYRDIDKARILYNHLWHSAAVTDQARLAVATNRSYMELIQHPAYNPRLIEYITGLAYYHLTASDNADFLGFAKAVLDNPHEIWRHAFERQLDSASRDLVTATASLVNDAEVEAVRTSARAIGSVSHRNYTDQELEDSLRAIEDTFVRVRQQNISSRTYLVLANPSISDYVAGRLRMSELEARSAVEGVTHFEQLDWLRNVVVEKASETTRSRLRTVLARAARRSHSASGVGDIGPPRNYQALSREVGRVVFLADLAASGREYLDELGPWLEDVIQKNLDKFTGSTALLGEVSQMCLCLTDAGLATEEVRVLREHIWRHVDDPDDWSRAVILFDRIPPSKQPVQSVAEKFEEWAIWKLEEDAGSLSSCDEVVEIQRIAEEVGASLDEDLCNETYSYLEERDREPEPEDSSPYDRGSTLSERVGAGRDEAQMAALFALMEESAKE